MNKRGLTLYEWLFIGAIALVLIATLATCILWVVAMTKYANTPVTELPAWAYWILK